VKSKGGDRDFHNVLPVFALSILLGVRAGIWGHVAIRLTIARYAFAVATTALTRSADAEASASLVCDGHSKVFCGRRRTRFSR
jgi:hypothetical protein